MSDVLFKICAMCKQLKSFEEFHKNITRPDGRHCYCKLCLKEYHSTVNWQNHKSQYDEEYNIRSEVVTRRKVLRQLWRRNHVNKVRYYAALHRATVIRCTPKYADLKAIEQFYIHCPEGYEVDHDFPLRGKYVSGLHVLSNLRYLTRSENRKKGNKFDPIAYNNLKNKE